MDRSSAALGDAAAEFRSGQTDFVAEHPKHGRFLFDIKGMRFTVNVENEHATS
jgi:hypothetical protein